MSDIDRDFKTVNRNLRVGGKAALSRIREEWEDTADSNRVWQEVAQEVCAATGATALVHVPAIFDALRAEVERLKRERDNLDLTLRQVFGDPPMTVGQLRAENERLRAVADVLHLVHVDNERLRKAMRQHHCTAAREEGADLRAALHLDQGEALQPLGEHGWQSGFEVVQPDKEETP